MSGATKKRRSTRRRTSATRCEVRRPVLCRRATREAWSAPEPMKDHIFSEGFGFFFLGGGGGGVGMNGPVRPRSAERKSRFTFLFFAPARAPLTRCRTLARTPGRPQPHPHSPPLPALTLLARGRAPSFFKKSHTLASAGSLASGRRSPSFSVNTHTPPLRCPPPRWRWTPPPMRSNLCGWCVGERAGAEWERMPPRPSQPNLAARTPLQPPSSSLHPPPQTHTHHSVGRPRPARQRAGPPGHAGRQL